MFSTAVIYTMTRSIWGVRILFHLTDYSPSGKGVMVGIKPRTITEAREDLYLLAFSAWLAQSAFFYYPEPKVVSLPVGWTLIHQTIIKKMPHSLTYRKSNGYNLSVKVFSSQMTSACIKMTKRWLKLILWCFYLFARIFNIKVYNTFKIVWRKWGPIFKSIASNVLQHGKYSRRKHLSIREKKKGTLFF